VDPTKCGNAGPGPSPHSCPVAASGQAVGVFDCGYGAHIKWAVETVTPSEGSEASESTGESAGGSAGGSAVTLALGGQSTFMHAATATGPASTKLCLTVTALPSTDTPTKLMRAHGQYTNATALAPCAGLPSQQFVQDAQNRLTFKQSDGQVGCFDCTHCQDGPNRAKLWLYTPCFGGDKPSPNEQFTYNKALETFVTPFNDHCIGVCPSSR
jgi:hypothetical protein